MADRTIFVYNEPRAANLDISQIAAYLRETVPLLRVEVRDEFVACALLRNPDLLDELSERFAAIRIRDAFKPIPKRCPLPAEVAYEQRRLTDPSLRAFGVLYDAERVLWQYRRLLATEESGDSHIAFTNQLIGTWDNGDRRYHARTVICSSPSIISTTGLVEAPARSREYYVVRQQMLTLGMHEVTETMMGNDMTSQALLHDDERLTEVAKGYALQAVAYYLTGSPFCTDRGCRLFNAHWQAEMLYAQLESPYDLCDKHKRLFTNALD